jgi:hypothetical protein
MMLAICLSLIAFIMFRYISSIPSFFVVFTIKGCWMLLKASVGMIMWFLHLILFIWCIKLIDLHVFSNPWITVMKPTRSWCMIFLMCCWIENFCIYFHQGNWSVLFFFCCVFIWFGIRVMLNSQNEYSSIPSLSILWSIWRSICVL